MRAWQALKECESGNISNFDYSVDAGVEDELRTGERWCEYTAWDFYGHVWFEDGQFKCDVWRYKSPVKIVEAETLEQLMRTVSDEFGYE